MLWFLVATASMLVGCQLPVQDLAFDSASSSDQKQVQFAAARELEARGKWAEAGEIYQQSSSNSCRRGADRTEDPVETQSFPLVATGISNQPGDSD